MNTASIRNYIQVEILNDPNLAIAEDEDLLLSGLLDSLGVARLVDHLEKELKREIPPEDVTLENFQTLNNIVSYLGVTAA